MREKDRKEIVKMIADALREFAGDVACYINYYSDRLSAVEDRLGIKVEDYPQYLQKYIEEAEER